MSGDEGTDDTVEHLGAQRRGDDKTGLDLQLGEVVIDAAGQVRGERVTEDRAGLLGVQGSGAESEQQRFLDQRTTLAGGDGA
ncbi:hypothetical protein AB0C28_32740 [Nonomuraea sp. NPDC048892]|uniref:hypothetical protein n=1 Tax=Nonomuraea sp. NPDC048892 TaxID=3154624 RepID=UPI0033D2BD96